MLKQNHTPRSTRRFLKQILWILYFCASAKQFSGYTHVAGTCCESKTLQLCNEYIKLKHVTKYRPRTPARLFAGSKEEYESVRMFHGNNNIPNTRQQVKFSERMSCTHMKPACVRHEQASLIAKQWLFELQYVMFTKMHLPNWVLRLSPQANLTGRKSPLNFFWCLDVKPLHLSCEDVSARPIQ